MRRRQRCLRLAAFLRALRNFFCRSGRDSRSSAGASSRGRIGVSRGPLRCIVAAQGPENTWRDCPVAFAGGFLPVRRTLRPPGIGAPPGAGQGQAPGPRHRQGRRLSRRSVRRLPRRRAPRAVHPDRLRRVGRGDSGPGGRHRRGGEVLERRGLDAPSDPPSHRTPADRRDGGAEGEVPHRNCRGDAAGGLRALRAPGGK